MTRVAGGVDADYLRDLFAGFGPVAVRRMFGGAGIFADGLMFALVADNAVYLKCAPDDCAAFAREGTAPFGYATKTGRKVLTSYWRLPDRLYDDPDEFAVWARTAFAAARQAGARPARKRKT